MFKLIEFVFLLVLVCILFFAAKSSKEFPTELDQLIYEIDYVEEIPGNLGNFRSKQLTANQIRYLVQSGLVKHIIRMNGDGKDSGGCPRSVEKAIVERYGKEHGVKYHEFNLHANEDDVYKMHELMKEGGVWIHCLHGYDRTGAVVAYHLKQLLFSIDFILKHNRWGKDYVNRKGEKYKFYYDFLFKKPSIEIN